ncbi:MAG: hypothetical protein O2931_11280 [Planctomycetota bacterium]|nr:hypothetical protein [Planctomycetota bacterium]MDA1179367.1 hypothetical protein [Planctomycetota bacterium]
MYRISQTTCVFFVLLAQALRPSAATRAEDIAAKFSRVTEDLTAEQVILAYRYQKGEQLRYRVEHVSTVETRMKGVLQTSKSRSESVKLWKIVDTNSQDKTMQFEHVIQSVDMWNEVSGKKPVRYNSQTDEKPPAQYANVAESVGNPLALITINESGQILARKDHVQQIDIGMGGTSIPLPDRAVPVGHEWSSPFELRVRDSQQRFLAIKTRQVYRLTNLSAGIATITVKTQVLTPLRDPAVRSQILQRLSNGEMKFDVDAGRLVRRELNWQETVVGFSGQDSNMKYMARLIETLESEQPDSPLAAAEPSPATSL